MTTDFNVSCSEPKRPAIARYCRKLQLELATAAVSADSSEPTRFADNPHSQHCLLGAALSPDNHKLVTPNEPEHTPKINNEL